MNRTHNTLWLTIAYALSARMCACQIWGTGCMNMKGGEMVHPLQTVHLCLLSISLGLSVPPLNWSVLRECEREPLQSYRCRAAVSFYNALLRSNSSTLSKMLQANVEMSSLSCKCWTSEILAVCMGLDRYNTFVVDFRKRLRGVWNADALAEHVELTNKLTKYHHWVAIPLSVHGAPFPVPRYLHLDVGKHMLSNIARFRLHAHTLKIETSLWQEHTSERDRCNQGDSKMKSMQCSILAFLCLPLKDFCTSVL
eukprot:1143980-Pelagomonas_calceolata.AAC.2